MNVYIGHEPVLVGVSLKDHTEHASVTVDDQVHIDADDSEHVIRIKHGLDDGVDILRAVDKSSGATTMRIDSNGDLHTGDVSFENASGASRRVRQLDTILEDAGSTDDGSKSNLVERSISDGAQINNLHVEARSSGYTKSFPPPGLYFTEATGRGELNMIEDGRIRFQPYDVGGTAIMDRTFAFGRAVPEGNETDVTADARRDGLLLEDATLDQSAEIMVSNTLPTMRLIGSKQVTTVGGHTEPVCPVIDVQDGNEISRFAVYDDGFVGQKGHRDIAPSTLNTGHFSSVVAGDESLYVGSCKISYDRAAKALMFRRLKEAVPVYLAALGVTQAPNGHTLASMTVHGWVAYAREHQSNARLTVHDVLPPANADWDEAFTLKRGSETLSTESALATERARIDAILNLSQQDLDTFREIELAFKAADSSIEQTVTNLTTSAAAARAVIQADLDLSLIHI